MERIRTNWNAVTRSALRSIGVENGTVICGIGCDHPERLVDSIPDGQYREIRLGAFIEYTMAISAFSWRLGPERKFYLETVIKSLQQKQSLRS